MGNRFSKEVEDFVSAFRTGNDIGYKMRYLRYLEKQQELNRQKLDLRQQRGTGGGMPTDTQDLINQGRDKRFGPGSENETTPPATKQATVQPKKAEIPDATPTTQPNKSSDASATTPSSGGGGQSGGEKHSSITDKYPGSYQTAALETGTMNDASPVRPSSPTLQSGATPSVAKFDAKGAPSYLDAIAQKHGIDPNDFKRMAWIESKFDPNAHAKSSSAGGLFQFTDGTAKTYGLKNKFDGPANAEAAARLWNDNKAGLTQALGRAPTAGELYLAHQQGLGGAKALLSNPNASAASLLGRDAVVNNGGRANMSARDFSNMWTGRFDNVGHESGTTPAARDTGTTASPTQAVNTRQRTAADASSMSDANNDIRRTGGMQAAVTPASTTPTSGGARYSSGASPEGKTYKEAYNESINNARPAPATPSATPAQPAAAPPGTHYVEYGPNKILIDDKTGAPVENLKGWEHASEPAKAVNNETSTTPTKQEAPEFPKTAGQEPPTPPSRSEELKQAVGGEPLQPASQPTADASQPGGWDLLDQLGQGFDQLGSDVQSFFNDLNVSADWDVGSSAGADMGGGDIGGDFGGIGDFFGGIGGAIGGLFNRGGMVR